LVSIRPRPGSRGKPQSPLLPAWATARFQSAPGRAAGGNGTFLKGALRFLVSIRPRPGSRGKPYQREYIYIYGRVSIRPRPGSRGKRAVVADWIDMLLEFQSAPGRAAGGNAALLARLASATRFNPPPAGQPGETSLPCPLGHPGNCFNPPPAGQPGETRGSRSCGNRHAQGFNPPPAGQPGETSCG